MHRDNPGRCSEPRPFCRGAPGASPQPGLGEGPGSAQPEPTGCQGGVTGPFLPLDSSGLLGRNFPGVFWGSAGWVGGRTGFPSAPVGSLNWGSQCHQDCDGSTGGRRRCGSADGDSLVPVWAPQRVGPPGCHLPCPGFADGACWVTLVCPTPAGMDKLCPVPTGGVQTPPPRPLQPRWLLLPGLCCAGGAGTGRGTSPPLIASDIPPSPAFPGLLHYFYKFRFFLFIER